MKRSPTALPGDGALSSRSGRGVVAIAVVAFLALIAMQYDRASGFTRLIEFGDHFATNRLATVAATQPYEHSHSFGYDGQFYAQLATSPWLGDPGLAAALDNPAYRARRIGLPWLAWIAGAGRTAWILQAYALANVVAWLALALVLRRWLEPNNPAGVVAWIGCLFGVGTLMSVGRALTDLPSALLIALAILLAERGKRLGAGIAFALALLTRETSLLAGALLAPTTRTTVVRWLEAGMTLAASVLPLALWIVFVGRCFPQPNVVDGANFAAPFTALIGSLEAVHRAVPRNGWHFFVVQLASTLGLCTQCVFVIAAAPRAWRTRWWRVGAAFALLFAVLGPAVWEDYTAAARAVIPMTLAFNILLPRDRAWSVPLGVAGNLPVVHGLVFLLPPGWLPRW